MKPRCETCDLDFQREPGFYLGSVYINYGLTAVILTIAFPLLMLTGAMSSEVLLGALSVFCVVFATWFFRYARALWLAFDQFWDPQPPAAKRDDAP